MDTDPTPEAPPRRRSFALIFALAAYGCIFSVLSMKYLESLFWHSWGRDLRRLDLGLVFMILVPVCLLLSLASFLIQHGKNANCRKDTVGALLSLLLVLFALSLCFLH